ncbi:extracellular solute-binding protein family 1 [Clostridium sp. CAG:768]|nr:extracellular solute-binding protein family 1 [Clostridium sp. CAG:768]
MKKFLLILVVILLVAITIPYGKNQDNSNEIIFWTLQMSDFSPYMNKVIKEFEEQNPEIKIKWVDVPFSEGEKRTLASVLSANPPDLINLNPDFSALLAQRGALYEIDEQYTGQFNKHIINSLKYNGKLYSLPWYATSAVTIYNKKLLSKSGAKMPETFEDLGEIAPLIKEKTGAYVLLPNITENDTMLRILNKYGVTVLNINSDQSIQVFDYFKNLYEKDLIPKESVTQTHREALEKYMAEQIVFFQAGANFLNMIKENAPSTYKNTDVAPQITGKLGQNDFSLMNFVIPVRAKHKQEALKFALFLTNYENQLELVKLTNVLAVNEETLKDDFYTTYDKNDLMAKARVISANQLYKIEPSFKTLKDQKEVNTIVNSAVQQILLNKNTTKNILDDVLNKINMLESD